MKRITWTSTAVSPPPKPSIRQYDWKVTPRMPVLLEGRTGFYTGYVIEHADEDSYWLVEGVHGDFVVTHFMELGKLPNE